MNWVPNPRATYNFTAHLPDGQAHIRVTLPTSSMPFPARTHDTMKVHSKLCKMGVSENRLDRKYGNYYFFDFFGLLQWQPLPLMF